MQAKCPGSEIKICNRTYNEYVELVKDFHGHMAPGVIIGGFMVDLAYQNLPQGEFFDVVCETGKCLPDAVQLLTPCTIGNDWLKVVNLGRFAFSMYEKQTGDGIRVFVDSNKLENWPELKTFFFKLKPKDEQNSDELMREVVAAGTSIFGIQKIKIKHGHLTRKRKGLLAVCPVCHEGFPANDGKICLGCQGQAPYSID